MLPGERSLSIGQTKERQEPNPLYKEPNKRETLGRSPPLGEAIPFNEHLYNYTKLPIWGNVCSLKYAREKHAKTGEVGERDWVMLKKFERVFL